MAWGVRDGRGREARLSNLRHREAPPSQLWHSYLFRGMIDCPVDFIHFIRNNTILDVSPKNTRVKMNTPL